MKHRPGHPWFDGLPDRYIVGHRGAAGHRPENTMASFRHALELGAHTLELDIHLTADGHLVVLHDETLERTTDGAGRVNNMTLDALQQLDAGYRFSTDNGRTFPWRDKGLRIPALEEVIDELSDTRLVVEIKGRGPATTQALATFLTKRDLTKHVLVGCFADPALHRFRALAPTYATCAGVVETRRFVARTHLRLPAAQPRYNGLLVPIRKHGLPIVTPRTVARARALGLHVQVWTVNEPAVMRMLYGFGAHAMTTDYPDRARTVVQEFEQKLAKGN